MRTETEIRDRIAYLKAYVRSLNSTATNYYEREGEYVDIADQLVEEADDYILEIQTLKWVLRGNEVISE